MECKFYVGQQVACVDDGRWFHLQSGGTHRSGPRRGDVLVVSRLFRERVVLLGEALDCVFLMFREWPHEAYLHDSFRPLERQRTDAAVERLRRLVDRARAPA